MARLNHSGSFDTHLFPEGSGLHGAETITARATHGSAGAIIVPDAQLLFAGDYKRDGVDLILSKDGRELVLRDYFRGEKHAALSSPDGALLTGDIVDALTGHTQFAQADGTAGAARVIGHVTKLAGNATAIRNGVSIILHQGDNVEKGDVVQAGSDSSLGITFIDGTVFGLSSNARMVLNDMVYDPNGSNNSSLLSLVQGTITFVAGETAKHGDMKVNTPVATMGIRGTAVLVEIDFTVPGQTANAPPVKFQVLVEPDGHTGSYNLYSLTDPNVVIGTVNAAGVVSIVNAAGNLSTQAAPPLSLAAQEIIGQTFQTYFQSSPNNPNPRSNGPPGSTPPSPPPEGKPGDTSPIKFDTGTPTTVTIPVNLPAPTPTNPNAINPIPTQIPVTITVLKSIDVTPVVDTPSFNIGSQVTITDSIPSDTILPYVPGTAKILSVTGPAPAGTNLASLVSVNEQTGNVTYSPQSFAFLQAGQKVTVTVGFDSQAGTNTYPETLTLTIDNVLPTVTVATPGGATSNPQQTISGTVADSHAAVGTTVVLYDTVNGVTTKIGTATVNSDGTWSTTVKLSGDGAHSIVAEDTDAAGNTGSSAPVVLTLDTIAPTVTISSSGGLTNQATHTISGTVTATEAAVGATVTLYDTINGVTTEIGTATVGNGGAWSTSVTLSGNGAHSIVAKDTDDAGNTGSSAPVVLTLDTIAPAVTINTAAETSNVATQTISGTVTAVEAAVGATVTLYDTINGVTTEIGTATVGNGGAWSTSVTLSGDGAHSIVAKDTDAAGNTGSSAPVVLTLDTIAPTVTITTAAETSNVATQTISGTVTAAEAAVGATVTLYDTINGVTTEIGTATVGSGGAWSTSVTLSGNGAHSIVAKDTDAAGNTGSSAPVVFTLDTIAPTVTITTAAETSNVATQTISGTVTAAEAAVGATVTLYDTINGVTTEIGTATVGSGGAWSTSVTLSGDGAHSIVAKDTDAAGNTGSSAPVVFTLDTIAPTVTISSSGGLTNQATHTISGTVTGTEAAVGATVTLYETINGVTTEIGTATVGAGGAWSTSVTLSGDGAHSIVAKDTDAAGNTGSSAPVVLTLDTIAPTVTITTAAETSNVATQTISGTVTAAEAAVGATVTLYDTINGVTTEIGTATVGAGGAWSTSVTLSGNGAHSIVAKDTDAAGNTGSSAPVVLTLDTIAPTVTITTAAETSNVATQTISGTVTAAEAAVGATVTLYDTINGVTTEIGTATVGSGGAWSTSVTLSGNGAHSIVAKDTDAAGNAGSSAPVVLTLDTIAPTVTITTAAETSNVATQTISGTVTATEAAVGATVTLYDTINGVTTAIGTATVGAGGAWSTSVTLSGNGAHSIVAKDTDAAGNTGSSAPVVLTLDTIAPTVTITTAAETSNVATQTISGTVTAAEAAVGATVTLYDTVNGVTTEIGTATVGNGGAWSTSVTLSGDGAHSIVAKDTDAAGNTGSSAPVVLTLDTIAPTVTITTAAETSNVATQTISGTVTAAEAAVGATVTLYDTVNGVTTEIGTATVGNGGAWSTSVTLSGDGAHSIVAKDTDAAGNTGSSAPVVLTLDTIAPTVTISSSGGLTNQATHTISGTVTAAEAAVGATVTLYDTVNGVTTEIGTATVGAGGAWSTSVTLSGNGAHSIVAKDTDAAGNTGSSAPVVLTLDTIAPTVTITTAAETSNVATQTISGTVTAAEAAVGATVTLYDTINGVTTEIGTATVGSGGAWSTSVTLSGNGAHSIVAKDTDAAGNTGSSAPVVLTLDTIAPTVTITTAAETSNVATQTISGTVTAAEAAVGATVTLYDTVNGVTTEIGTATVGNGGAWSTSVTLSGDGAHSIVAKDTDAAGNTGSSAPVVLTLDTIAPTVTISSSGGLTNQATHTISGTVTAAEAAVGATVTLYDTINGVTTAIGTATVGSGGAWSTSVTLSGDGSHSIVAKDTDAAGNTGSSAPVVLTLDTIAPTVTVTTAAETSNVATQTISGTVTAAEAAVGATVTLYDTVNGVTTEIGTATVGSGGAWSTSVTLSGNGAHSIVAKDTDAAGNTGSSAPVVLTLDTIAPTVTITTAAETSNVATQTISGTVTAAEAAVGATVTLYDTINGVTTEIGTATVGAGGAWSTSVTLSGNGAHSIVAKDTDAAGNTGSSAPVVLTLDTIAPTVTITTAAETSNVATQTISGTVAAAEAAVGATVTLYDTLNGVTTAIGTATVGSGGAWSTSVTLSGNGAHSIVAKDTDAAGNTGSSAPVVFTLDTIAPTVTIATAAETSNVATQTISGTVTAAEAAAGATVTLYDTVNGVTTAIGTATVGAGGAWSTSVTLSGDGSHSIVAKDTDAAGNTGSSAPVVLTLDTIAPTVTISSSGGLTNQATHTISGTVAAGEAAVGSTVYLYDNGGSTAIGTATVGSGGAWSTSVTLSANGAHSIVAKDTDAAGNTGSSAPVVLTLDTISPTVTITTAAETSNVATQTISGTVTAAEAAVGATVTLYDTINGVTTAIGTATAGSGGAWSTSVTLSGDGAHSIVAKDTDAAGNTGSSAPVVLTLDTVAPTVTISSSGGLTNQATQTISGTVTAGEAAVGSTVYLYDNGGSTAIGTATVGSGGAWSTSVTLSGDGAHSIVAKDTDAAGNTGSSATPVVFTLDTIAPTVTITTAAETSGVATQTISGTVTAVEAAVGATVTLYDTLNGVTTAIGTATVGSGGAWSTSVTLSGAGAHSIVAEDTDAAGNTGSSAPVALTLLSEPFVWASDASGDWSVPGNWNNNVVPGTNDQVQISYSNIAVTVSSTVAADTLSSAATLDIESGGSLSLSGTSSNSGTIEISGTLTLSNGTLVNSGEQIGSITAESGGSLTVYGGTIKGGAVTIDAGGTFDLARGTGLVVTLDGVSVSSDGNIDVDPQVSGAILMLDDDTTITGGTLSIGKISGQSVELDIEVGTSGPGATLDGVTVTNDGQIDVDLNASGAILTLDGGTTISGGMLTVGLHGRLDIESGAGATLDGVSINNSGTVQVDATKSTSTLTLVDGTTISGGGLTIGGGSTLNIAYGSNDLGATLDDVSVSNSGTIQIGTLAGDLTLKLEDGTTISGGTISVGAYSTLALNGATISGATIDETGTGSDVDVKAGSTITGGASLNDGDVSIESGQTLTLGNVTVSGATFNFFGFGDTLKIGQPSSFNGAIAGLASGDAIDLTSVTYGSNGYSVWTQTSTTNGGTGILQIYDGSALQATLDLTGIYSQGDFTLTADGSQGTDVNIGDVNINHVSFYSGTINSNGVYTPQILKGGGSLQLTNGNGGEAASWFANTTYSISSFTGSFDYQAIVGEDPADGLAFILQNSTAGAQALGTGGGDLGYTGISPSAAIEFNLYPTYGQGTAFETNGNTGATAYLGEGGSSYQSTGNVDFVAGDPMQVVVSYNGTVLTEILTDLTTGATYTAEYTVNLASYLGGSTAYVGFSAGTGSSVSTQTVSDFTFTNSTTDDWLGATGSWTDATRWSLGLPPNPGSVVVIVGGGNPQIQSGSLTLDGITVQNGGEIDVTSVALLILEDGTAIAGGELSIGSTLEILNGSGNIGATLDNVHVINNGTIEIGTIDIDPTLTLADGTTISGGEILIGSDSTLDIEPGMNGHGVALSNVSVATFNSGTITVGGDSTLTLDGVTIGGVTVDDYSTVSSVVAPGLIDITGSSTINEVVLNGGTVKIESGATLLVALNATVTGTVFNDTGLASLLQVDGGSTLTLDGATITGGVIDNGSVVSGEFIAGQIDISASSTINGGAILYGGNVTIGAGQTLRLDNVTVNGTTFNDTASGGIIQVDGGDALTLNGVTIEGGTFSIAGTVDIVGATTTLDINPITNSGLLAVVAGGTLDVQSSEIDNAGAGILIGAASELLVDNASGLQLTGGEVVLQADSRITENSSNQNVALGNVLALDIADTITGSGEIGSGAISHNESTIGSLDLTNEAGGIIDASGGTLTIDTGQAITNSGTLEASTGSMLVIDDAVTGTGSETIADGAVLELDSSVA